MKRTILLFALIITFAAARAQYITILDSNFGTWLNGQYPTCMTRTGSVWKMDTTCSSITTATGISISQEFTIRKMNGLKYFRQLNTLAITYTYIDTLVDLPASLQYLIENKNVYLNGFPTLPSGLLHLDLSSPATWASASMTNLPALPSSLRYLDCSGVRITSMVLPSLPSSIDTVICDRSNLNSLPALSGFTHLVYLSCNSNALSSLSTLPSSLTYLDCGSNIGIHSLPSLPSSLITLNCYGDSLTVLPTLPSTLVQIGCSNNQLTSLPSLPAGLIYLSCQSNPSLASLPALPTTLKVINSYYCNLSSLPALPDSLLVLNVNYNRQLAQIPSLPAHLQELHASHCNLGALPSLVSTLAWLECDSNHISALPPLTVSVSHISCSYNNLTSIGPFAGGPYNTGTVYPLGVYQWFNLDCSHNHITSISPLPINNWQPTGNTMQLNVSYNNLTSLPAIYGYWTVDISHNPTLSCLERLDYVTNYDYTATAITCMPNKVNPSLSPVYAPADPNNLPLCNNTSGCPFYYNISGNTHIDTAANCQTDSLYNYAPLRGVKVLMSSHGTVVKQSYTYGNYGEYSIKADSLTAYSLSVDTSSIPFHVTCPVLEYRAVTLSLADSLALHQDFGLRCAGADNGVQSIIARIRYLVPSTITINAGDMALLSYGGSCHISSSGTVTTTLGPHISYQGPAAGALTPTSVSGNVITYAVPEFDSLPAGAFSIIVLSDTSSQSTYVVTSVQTDGGIDANPSNDAMTYQLTIYSSLDPNEKSVSPINAVDTGSQWLDYTIFFQNTGNDTAYLVVIKDTLSSHVDPLSFQYLASDHKVLTDVVGRVVTFTFPKVNLLDSLHHTSQSTGWVQYRVKTDGGLALGTQVSNTAYIYFDQNQPIVTNTTVNIVQVDTIHLGISTTNPATNLHIYPNPNKGSLMLVSSGVIGEEYTITDMLGHLVQQQRIMSVKQMVELPEAADGLYILTVKGSQPIRFTILR